MPPMKIIKLCVYVSAHKSRQIFSIKFNQDFFLITSHLQHKNFFNVIITFFYKICPIKKKKRGSEGCMFVSRCVYVQHKKGKY